MTYTLTKTITFTITDIGKVVDCFGADLDMISQSTGLLDYQAVGKYTYDIKEFANNGYLKKVHIVLQDQNSNTVRAVRYDVSENAMLWTNSRPGDNLWPHANGGKLNMVVTISEKWYQLTDPQKAQFLNTLYYNWGPSTLDLSFSGLSQNQDRCYVSNSYGMRRTIFGS